jgi:hypothetical protein
VSAFLSSDDLKLYEGRAPFFTHPYQHWTTYREYRPDHLFDTWLEELRISLGAKFTVREDDAKRDLDPLNFFGFYSEVKVAQFVQSKIQNFEFTADINCPDFKCDDVFIEVTSPLKKEAVLVRLQEELAKIDKRFRLRRRNAVALSILDEDPYTFGERVWTAIQPLLLESRKFTTLSLSPQCIWGDRENDNLWGELIDESIYQTANPHNAHGDGRNSVIQFSNELLKSKVGKNGLSSHHPNIVWAESLYLTEFQSDGHRELEWHLLRPMRDIDVVLITASGLDASYDAHSSRVIFALENKTANANDVAAAKRLIFQLFPDLDIKFIPIPSPTTSNANN